MFIPKLNGWDMVKELLPPGTPLPIVAIPKVLALKFGGGLTNNEVLLDITGAPTSSGGVTSKPILPFRAILIGFE